MTPEAKADEILSDWTSNNFLHQSAKPSLKAQIVKVIEHDRREMGLLILEVIDADERIGMKTKDLIAEHVMGILNVTEGETV